MATTLLSVVSTAFPSGTTNSGNFTPPVVPFERLKITFGLAPAQLSDATLSMTFFIQKQVGGVFTDTDGFSTSTGFNGIQPSLNVDPLAYANKLTRLRFTANKPVTTALTVQGGTAVEFPPRG